MKRKGMIAAIIVIALIVVIMATILSQLIDKTTPSQKAILSASDMPGEGWSGSAQAAYHNELMYYLTTDEGVSDACYTFIQRGDPHDRTVWVFLAHWNSTADAAARYAGQINSTDHMYVFDLSNLSWAGDSCWVEGYTYNYSAHPRFYLDNDNRTVFTLVKGEYSVLMLFASKAGSEFSYDEMLALVKAQADKIPA